jgi:hypothetical protein
MPTERFWPRRWSRRDGVPARVRRVAETRPTTAARQPAWLLASGRWRFPALSRRRSAGAATPLPSPAAGAPPSAVAADRGPAPPRFFDCAVRRGRQAGSRRRYLCADPGRRLLFVHHHGSALARRNSRPNASAGPKTRKSRVPLAMLSLLRVGIAASRARPFLRTAELGGRRRTPRRSLLSVVLSRLRLKKPEGGTAYGRQYLPSASSWRGGRLRSAPARQGRGLQAAADVDRGGTPRLAAPTALRTTVAQSDAATRHSQGIGCWCGWLGHAVAAACRLD